MQYLLESLYFLAYVSYMGLLERILDPVTLSGDQRYQHELRRSCRPFRVIRILPQASRYLYEDPIHHGDDRDHRKDPNRIALYNIPCSTTG
jgi:hypothetical protein